MPPKGWKSGQPQGSIVEKPADIQSLADSINYPWPGSNTVESTTAHITDMGTVEQDIPEQVVDILDNIPEPTIVKQPIIIQEPKQIYMNTTAQSYTPTIKGLVSIKAYITDVPNMGHEKYNEVLFPGTGQRDEVFCLTNGNVRTYRTGLNEFAYEIQSIADPEEKIAKIREIRKTVAWLENTVNANFEVKPGTCMDGYGTNEDIFWNNVTMFQSVCVDKFDNKGNRILSYWDRLYIDLSNDGRPINKKDPHDICVYNVVCAGGFGMVAPSLQTAIETGDYNFYLHRAEDVAAIKTESKQSRNQAGGYLEELRTGDGNKLFFLSKLMTVEGSIYYKMGGDSATPPLQMYNDLCDMVDGKTPHRSSKEAVEQFLKLYKKDSDELMVRTIVKDACELKLIDIRSNGQMTYIRTNTNLGRNIEDVVASVLNPTNDEILKMLVADVNKVWRE